MPIETTEPAPTVWMGDLYALANKIGLTSGQWAAIAAWAWQQEREVIHQAAEICAEHPFIPEGVDESQGRV